MIEMLDVGRRTEQALNAPSHSCTAISKSPFTRKIQYLNISKSPRDDFFGQRCSVITVCLLEVFWSVEFISHKNLYSTVSKVYFLFRLVSLSARFALFELPPLATATSRMMSSNFVDRLSLFVVVDISKSVSFDAR
jgi:hypothetical protein